MGLGDVPAEAGRGRVGDVARRVFFHAGLGIKHGWWYQGGLGHEA